MEFLSAVHSRRPAPDRAASSPLREARPCRAKGADTVRRLGFALLGALLLSGAGATAETGAEGWLRYAPLQDARVKAQYGTLPDSVVSLDKSPVVQSAENELGRGVGGMLGRKLRLESTIPSDGAFVLGTV